MAKAAKGQEKDSKASQGQQPGDKKRGEKSQSQYRRAMTCNERSLSRDEPRIQATATYRSAEM